MNDSRRVPNLILTAHVHNYQRIERKLADGMKIPFLVNGNGGYHHLHGLNAKNDDKDPETHARLIASDDKRFGFVTLLIDDERIFGTQTAIDLKSGEIDRKADRFEYSAKPLYLPDGAVVSL